MNRRDFIRIAGVAGAAAAAETPMAALTRKAGEKPRQAIVILGESVRYDMLSCNAERGLHTPHMDRIAQRGVRFERAYNVQPVCAPARSAIWTGVTPHTNGVWGNSMPLGDTTHTIGQRLRDKGLHCAFMGKWHLSGTDYFDTGICPDGWDRHYWYDMRTYLEELSPTDRKRSRDTKTGDDPAWTKDYCYGYRVTERALDFIAKHKDEDYLLVVAYDEPHHPWLCPKEYTDRYRDFVFPASENVHDDLRNKPEEQRVWAGKRLQRKEAPPITSAQYFGAHAFIDDQIGRVLDAAEKQAPEALVMYTADHGVFLESHRLTDKGPAMYDEITRIPLLAMWPGVTPAGSVASSVVSHLDVAGTLMEYFGHDVPKTIEGGSLLPILKDPKARVHDEVFIEWGRYEVDHDGFGAVQPIRCVCDGRYKLAVNLMTTDELYDLKTDPQEMNNLIDSADHAGVRNHLHDRLLNWMDVSRDPFRGYYWGRRAWRPEYPVTWDNDGYTRQRENDGYLPRELDYDTGLTMTDAVRRKKLG
ncbi:MAG: sulfatase-like hydrolase/transferase [Acidobacteriota bacterium]